MVGTAEPLLYCIAPLARHRHGTVANFVVVVSFHLPKPAERSHGHHSGFWAGLYRQPASAWRAASSVGAYSSGSLGCWRVLHLTTPYSSSPSLRQEVGGATPCWPYPSHIHLKLLAHHTQVHTQPGPLPPCLFLRVLWVWAALHTSGLAQRYRAVADHASSNCRSNRTACRR